MLSADQSVELFKTLSPYVVKVLVYQPKIEMLDKFDWEGTGVILNQQGYVLALSHHLNDNPKAIVNLEDSNRTRYRNIRVLEINSELGLVMLKVEASGSGSGSGTNLEAVLVRVSKLKFGEQVFSVGHPFYMGFACSVGEIAHPHRKYSEVLQCKLHGEKPLTAKERKKMEELDESARYIRHAEGLGPLEKLSKSVSLVQFNNIHGDGLGACGGSPVFDRKKRMVGMYLFEANGVAFGIHAKEIISFIRKLIPEWTPPMASKNDN